MEMCSVVSGVHMSSRLGGSQAGCWGGRCGGLATGRL